MNTQTHGCTDRRGSRNSYLDIIGFLINLCTLICSKNFSSLLSNLFCTHILEFPTHPLLLSCSTNRDSMKNWLSCLNLLSRNLLQFQYRAICTHKFSSFQSVCRVIQRLLRIRVVHAYMHTKSMYVCVLTGESCIHQ